MNELRCRVPGCKWKPRGLMTGLQEARALEKHLRTAHLMPNMDLAQALEWRVKFENQSDDE